MMIAFEQLCLLLAFIALGFFFGKRGLAEHSHAKLLSVLTVYLFLPCTIFNSFSKNFTTANLKLYSPILLGSLIILLVLLPFAFFASRLISKKSYERLVLFYSLVVPNYGHMGYPLTESLFGAEGLLLFILFTLPVSLFTYTVGYSLLTKQPLRLRRLLNPVTMAVVLGVVCGLLDVRPPELAGQFLSKSAACLAPTGMLLAGLTISQFDVLPLLRKKQTYITCALRLLVIPICVSLTLQQLTDNVQLIRMATLFYSMSCGMNTIVFPKLVDEDCSIGASLALVSNILSVLTIPLCLSLL